MARHGPARRLGRLALARQAGPAADRASASCSASPASPKSFLILKAMDVGLAPPGRRWCWRCSAWPILLLAYPAGALSDRMDPESLLLGGIAVLVAADLWLAQAASLWAVFAGIAYGARTWR